MKKLHPLSWGNVRNVVFGLFTIGALLLLSNSTVQASHGRSSNIIIQPTANPNQLEIKVSQAWRRSFWSGGAGLNLGATRNPGGAILLTRLEGGFSQNLPINLTITAVNVAEDWFFGETTIIVNVPGTGTYRASYNICCKIQSQNNSSSLNVFNKATYVLGAGNKSPVSSLPPIVNLATGLPNAQFTVPAFDEDGDPIQFRMATRADYNNFSGFNQPPGMTINQTTGVVSFSTVGRAPGQLFNAVIMVQDNQGAEIMLDFLVRITQQSTPPLFDYTVTPNNASVFTTQPGTNVQFSIKATDNDPGDVVSLQAIGLPSGAIMTPALPANGNPVDAEFSWTPTSGQLGSFLVTFIAQDLAGVQTTTTLTVNVSLRPQFDANTPGAGSIFCLEPGQSQSQSGTITAFDPDTADVVSITTLTGMPASFALNGSLPSATANPTSLGYNFAPTASDWGQYTLSVTAVDGFNESSTRSWKYIVNDPPQISSTPITSVIANTLYSYTVTTSDLNIAEGDEVSFHHVTLPAWLTFTDNGDGTGVISGTPSIADAGMHAVVIHVQDLLNHIDGTHCGQAHQMFDIEVIPCNVSLSLTGTDPLCNGGTDGSVSATIQNAAAPIQYLWSNGATTASLSGVGAGTYSLTITDANNCSETSSVTLGEPTALTSSSSAATFNGDWNVSCNGAADGSATVNAQGGTGSYTYLWSNGATTATATGLTAGTYTVVVTDDNGCTSSSVVMLSEPTVLSSSSSATQYNGGWNVSCNGASDGSATVNAQGGTAPYSYSWSNGATTATATGLSAGTYEVTVTDANGCTSNSSISLSEPSMMESSVTVTPEYNVSPGGAQYTIYLGYGPQSVTLTGATLGGTPPYTYAWSGGAGLSNPAAISTEASPTQTTTYLFMATDANGCTMGATVMVNVVDARCGNNPRNPKVLVCKVPPGNPRNAHVICVSPNAVPAHLATGSYLGPCNQNNAMGDGSSAAFLLGKEMLVYPNPSAGSFNVQIQPDEATEVRIEVYDMKGKLVYGEFVPFGGGTEQHQINLEAEARGMYLLRVSYADQVHQERIVRQ